MAEPARAYHRVVFSGLVQGVGFRPAVRKLADELGVAGWVRNAGGLAECRLSGAPAALDALIREVGARFSILRADREPVAPFEADGFEIVESLDAAEGAPPLPALVPPDAPVCDDCLREMLGPSDRRHLHPFISCSACGPRYSILRALPYDRENTAMAGFSMCAACAGEYSDLADRRLHAQTIACPDCGPRLSYHGFEEEAACPGRESRCSAGGGDPIALAAGDILAGGIVAVKGIGGYHLCCLPEREPVERLRAVKGRDQKPFALMFRSVEDVEAVCEVGPGERRLMLSFARPIALLQVKTPEFSPNVASGSLEYGCFLPYTPVHHLLLRAVAGRARALVMTSANVSGEPILYQDREILEFGPGRLAGALIHDREIVNPLDDSVARVIDGGVQILRRARGYAPLPVPLYHAGGAELFAAGGDLKAAFCLLRPGCAYVGPHVGDLEDEGCLARYALLARNLAALLGARPERAACDLHPRYFSAKAARETGLPVLAVQHHHAHAASVMAEHGLERALGVAFDGTGYGADGAVWGGEFLLCEGAHFGRAGHLLPVSMIGGDESMRDAAKTAACYQRASGVEPEYRGWPVLRRALERSVNTVESSSMGRLFDAASAILGVCAENRYEGECAIRLEREAALARRAGISPAKLEFEVAERDGRMLADWRGLIRALSGAGARGESGEGAPCSVPALALGFHVAIAEMVERVCGALCERFGVRDVALSGGVFQNRLLTELCLAQLRARGLNGFVNRQVPPGDGGICLGQAFIASR